MQLCRMQKQEITNRKKSSVNGDVEQQSALSSQSPAQQQQRAAGGHRDMATGIISVATAFTTTAADVAS